MADFHTYELLFRTRLVVPAKADGSPKLVDHQALAQAVNGLIASSLTNEVGIGATESARTDPQPLERRCG